MGAAPASTRREQSVTAYLARDHERLDALLLSVAALMAAGQHEGARRECAAFEAALDRHLRLEEELLFPLFEARAGVSSGPTALLRGEHSQIRRGLAILREALEARDDTGFQDALRFLRETFEAHDSKEERLLFPATDQLLSASERRAVVERLHQG